MSKLRPECGTGSRARLMPDKDVYRSIAQALATRRMLIHGKLHDDEGHHCAMGAFWEIHPNVSVNQWVVDEVAAVNDAVPADVSPRVRWRVVRDWLRNKGYWA